jgi:hypothetical protein
MKRLNSDQMRVFTYVASRIRTRNSSIRIRLCRNDVRVRIATGYRLDGLGVGAEDAVGSTFPLFHVVRTCSGAHSATHLKGTGVKYSGQGADHPHPTRDEVKKTWNNDSINETHYNGARDGVVG